MCLFIVLISRMTMYNVNSAENKSDLIRCKCPFELFVCGDTGFLDLQFDKHILKCAYFQDLYYYYC